MTRTARAAWPIFGLLCSFGAPADNPIEETLRVRWIAAYNSGDAKALSAMYAADAQLEHGYCPTVTGRDEIEEFWRDDLGEGDFRTHLEVVDSLVLEDIVYASGRYAVEVEGSEDSSGGTYTQIWRREGKSDWVIYRESWKNFACVRLKPTPDEEDGDAPEGVGISL